MANALADEVNDVEDMLSMRRDQGCDATKYAREAGWGAGVHEAQISAVLILL